jgi:hypothetical protein
MRYKAKSVAALDIVLGDNLAVVIPHDHGPEARLR